MKSYYQNEPITYVGSASVIIPFGRGPYKYVWRFEDLETIIGEIVEKSWKDIGIKNAIVKATDILTGLSGEASVQVKIVPAIIAQSHLDNISPGHHPSLGPIPKQDQL